MEQYMTTKNDPDTHDNASTVKVDPADKTNAKNQKSHTARRKKLLPLDVVRRNGDAMLDGLIKPKTRKDEVLDVLRDKILLTLDRGISEVSVYNTLRSPNIGFTGSRAYLSKRIKEWRNQEK